ncbi:cobalt transporter CbiM [uncultured Desulfosarcina sp.]|uniref:cobalt transporter CbiM n=1 Tax=uncultured Desulfosarcina sp. TaxID=218289 RepID=UPI0029C7F15D|nr:cobalt transporter CbiM [uncultured Desulfosarcina sp.]
MHISEGVLSGPVLATGAAIALAGTAAGLKRMELDRVAQTGMLAAAFFVASLIHVPIGPSSVHLILNGVVGLLLGWAAFPAILTALLLQAMLFQFGGLTVLGVNTVIMAGPAVICYYCCGPFVLKSPPVAVTAAFVAGAGSVFLAGILVGVSLVFTGENFLEVAGLVVAAHLPIMVIEGIVTVFCVAFLKKVKPEMLPGYNAGKRV